MSTDNIKAIARHNLSTFRCQPLNEISGALGDLGTFLPIVIALTEGHQISLSTTLILTGICNIVTGAIFGIPLPVQPMKAIAAVAILRSFSSTQLAAAGIFVSTCIFIFSVTGLLRWFTNVIPIPVVKGIQVGAGLSLIIAAGSKALASLSWVGPSWADNYLWIIVAFLALLILNAGPRVPYALVVTIVGIVFAIIQLCTASRRRLPVLHMWHPHIQIPKGTDWRVGIIDAGLGQLPLTTLNSIIAVTHLAADLLPEVSTPSVTLVGFSVAAMNLFSCWFGAMPVCHGSGGLAAQYRFGARSGASIIFLGSLKLVLGLVFGESLADLLQKFPLALLTVMIIAAGLELASVGESLNTDRARDVKGSGTAALSDTERKRRWMVMMMTAGTLVAFKNDAVGFTVGMCCHSSFLLADKLEARRRRMEHSHEQEPLLG